MGVGLLGDDNYSWLAHTHSATHSLRNHNVRLAHSHTACHVHSHIRLSVAHLLVHHRLGLLITHILLLITHLLLLIAHLLLRVSAHLIVAHLLLRISAHLTVSHLLILNHHRLLLVSHAHAHRLLHSHTWSRIDHQDFSSSIYKFRHEVEFACWFSVERDFDPLLSPTRDRKYLQWQFTRSNNKFVVSTLIVNVDPYHCLTVSDFNVEKLLVEFCVLAAMNNTLRTPFLRLANVNMDDWVHPVEHAAGVMGEVSFK